MRQFFQLLLIVVGFTASSQCSFSATISYTPASCSTCCDGIIAPSITGPGMPCAPTKWELLPTYANLSGGVWANLCAGTYTANFITGCCIIPLMCLLPYITTNIEEIQKGAIKIYPNPASNIIYLSFTETDLGNFYFEIADPLGETVLQSSFRNEINISDLSKGCYILKVLSSDGYFQAKFIKE